MSIALSNGRIMLIRMDPSHGLPHINAYVFLVDAVDGDPLNEKDFSDNVLFELIKFTNVVCTSNDPILCIFSQASSKFIFEKIRFQGKFIGTNSIIANSKYNVLENMIASDTVDYNETRIAKVKQLVDHDVSLGVERIHLGKSEGEAAFLVEHRVFGSDAVFAVVRDISRSLPDANDYDRWHLNIMDIIAICKTMPKGVAVKVKRLIIEFRGKASTYDVTTLCSITNVESNMHVHADILESDSNQSD